MATPKLWCIVLVNKKNIFIPVNGVERVENIIYSELPESMRNGLLKNISNWSNAYEMYNYFQSLDPVISFREIIDIFKFFINKTKYPNNG